jgi:hypothetical protein
MRLEAPEHSQLNAILALTDEVQAAIGNGEWETATELDRRRRAALDTLLLDLARDPALTASLQQALTDLQTRTYHLIGEVDHHKRRLVREASMVTTGRRAAREYAAVSGER